MTTEDAIARAIAIGHDCVGITFALEQLKIAHSNANPSVSRYDYVDLPLFDALSRYRETLRAELLRLQA